MHRARRSHLVVAGGADDLAGAGVQLRVRQPFAPGSLGQRGVDRSRGSDRWSRAAPCPASGTPRAAVIDPQRGVQPLGVFDRQRLQGDQVAGQRWQGVPLVRMIGRAGQLGSCVGRGHLSIFAGRPADYAGQVRLSDFWKRMEARFGTTYAHSLAADYRVTGLGATINDAIERGDSPKSDLAGGLPGVRSAAEAALTCTHRARCRPGVSLHANRTCVRLESVDDRRSSTDLVRRAEMSVVGSNVAGTQLIDTRFRP